MPAIMNQVQYAVSLMQAGVGRESLRRPITYIQRNIRYEVQGVDRHREDRSGFRKIVLAMVHDHQRNGKYYRQ
jgi:hypothetical protein